MADLSQGWGSRQALHPATGSACRSRTRQDQALPMGPQALMSSQQAAQPQSELNVPPGEYLVAFGKAEALSCR
ncbi:MAG: hypothetical protein ACI8T1_000932 [Verrucomicrobiales bacterium]|jgi:hypothetical protein